MNNVILIEKSIYDHNDPKYSTYLLDATSGKPLSLKILDLKNFEFIRWPIPRISFQKSPIHTGNEALDEVSKSEFYNKQIDIK